MWWSMHGIINFAKAGFACLITLLRLVMHSVPLPALPAGRPAYTAPRRRPYWSLTGIDAQLFHQPLGLLLGSVEATKILLAA